MISSLGENGFRFAELETFPGGGGWGAGSSETKANLAQLGLELGLSLAIMDIINPFYEQFMKIVCDFIFIFISVVNMLIMFSNIFTPCLYQL